MCIVEVDLLPTLDGNIQAEWNFRFHGTERNGRYAKQRKKRPPRNTLTDLIDFPG